MQVKRALISVSDKTGIVEFARALTGHNVEIISTGGTAKLLSEHNIPVTPVDEITDVPEMMNGRVKTLHPRIHGAILGLRDNPDHVSDARAQNIEWIDMVVVNLYPFEQTVARQGIAIEEAVEQIDIGGPSMLRSAAKNYRYVAIVTDPADYQDIITEIDGDGLSLAFRQRLAVKAFRRTANYDAAIDTYLSTVFTDEPVRHLCFTRGRSLRYGENGHQSAIFYKDEQSQEPSVATAEILQGKALSYNNYVDADAALDVVKDLGDDPGVAVIKHTNPCGLATAGTIREALEAAWAGDPVSAFGSVIATNKPVDAPFASFLKGRDEIHIGYVIENGKLLPREMVSKFVEVIVAPDFTPEALQILARAKTLRLLKVGSLQAGSVEPVTYKKIVGGLLEMDRDQTMQKDFIVATEQGFDEDQKHLAYFAMTAAKHSKSNAIILARAFAPGCYQVMGMGAGQPNRIDSMRKLAVTKAVENLEIEYNAGKFNIPMAQYVRESMAAMVLASDAFFPFDDTVRAAAEAGIKYIVQPGGSKRDDDSIAACNELNVAMAMTGLRHFKH
ncbi:bifunctional phosphoribosylaminoimidazolecarboxamide formyltransferase/IMP cyclohydrolase [bacterium]|nr:bifunctional phosphoribosylaminoimidazolecarboxamide formyltransferase/IMP cyclohydrolase [bacterium]